MVQIPLRRAHRLRAITLASPIKKLRPQPTERTPTAWHTNDEYKNAEASEEASASSAVANASENRILPIPTPRHWLHQSCSYKRVSSVGRFYDGLRAARWRAERFLGLLAARGSGCALKTSRVSCLLITLSSSSAPTSLNARSQLSFDRNEGARWSNSPGQSRSQARRRSGREARPAEDRQRDRTQGAKAACEGLGYLEGCQVARHRNWHGPAHLKGASNEPARG